MEIVLPRLAKVMTVWEFVLMKVMNIYTLRLDSLCMQSEYNEVGLGNLSLFIS